jgi:hypothetical protein
VMAQRPPAPGGRHRQTDWSAPGGRHRHQTGRHLGAGTDRQTRRHLGAGTDRQTGRHLGAGRQTDWPAPGGRHRQADDTRTTLNPEAEAMLAHGTTLVVRALLDRSMGSSCMVPQCLSETTAHGTSELNIATPCNTFIVTDIDMSSSWAESRPTRRSSESHTEGSQTANGRSSKRHTDGS